MAMIFKNLNFYLIRDCLRYPKTIDIFISVCPDTYLAVSSFSDFCIPDSLSDFVSYEGIKPIPFKMLTNEYLIQCIIFY